ncbi:hypothetical protein [Streptomyces sp. NPDC055607]
MTNLNPGIAAKIAAASDHARPGSCTRCGAPVLRARVGRVAALDVIADETPIDLPGEIQALLEGRLTWFLVTGGTFGASRIAWRNPLFAPHDKHPVLRDHRCEGAS